jgi:hypothetical protein
MHYSNRKYREVRGKEIMISWRQALLIGLKMTVAFCASILALAIIYFVADFVISSSDRSAILETIGLGELVKGEGQIAPTPPQDWAAINPDFASVVNWVKYCLHIAPEQPLRDEIGVYFRSYTLGAGYDKNENATHVDLPNNRQIALLQLNSWLVDQRAPLLAKVRTTRSYAEFASWTTVILGLITTILVGLSSSDLIKGQQPSSQPSSQIHQITRILALIFPAITTAAAAIVSYYSPQTEWSQANRTLASLTQLHDDIALNVWNLTCPTSWDRASDALSAFSNAMKEWSKRYGDIQALSSASGINISTTGDNPTKK